MTTTTTPNLGFQNWYSSTLASGITATDTVLYLNSLPTPSEGFLVIEPDSTTNREIIFYNSKGANFVTVPSASDRGRGGTTAVSHNSGVTVQMNTVAEHFTALQDGTAFAVGGIGASPYADGWTPILGSTPNTVTYNGNRNYDLVFNSVDLTDTLSPGMKLQLTRTVAAPSQCTSLNGTTQYYSKSSPSGMTFTDDFVVSAWIKLNSYQAGTAQIIAARYNGTSGWHFFVSSDGTIVLGGLNAGAGNYSQVQSYASIPLGKWVHVTAQLDMSTFTATTTTSYVMIDGVDTAAKVARGGSNPTALIQAGNLEIGTENGGTLPLNGKIAQVAIYNAKVTQATIKASMNQTLSGSETSLISAYSFNNSINDLNANANNLTAQGSAVATNADSPFANAVSAGLLEYAEINSVTFSTNTTVNVRVPDTCQIPTTGGVSAVSYSTQSNPYGLPYFSKIIGQTIINTLSTTTSTTGAQVNGASITTVIPTGAKVKITGFIGCGMYSSNAGGMQLWTHIWDGTVGSGTQLQASRTDLANNNVANEIVCANVTPVSGSKTYNLGFHAAGGAGTTTIQSSTVYPTVFQVELV